MKANQDNSRGIKAILAGVLFLGIFILATNGSRGGSQVQAGTVATVRPATAVPTPTPSPAHIGSIVQLGNWRYSVRQVDTVKTIDVSTSQYFREVLQAKGTYVVVLLQLTNIGTRNFSIHDTDFELRDDKGIRYDPATFDQFRLVSQRGQAQLGDQFPPGVMLTTTLLFDVAPGTNGMYLYLTNVDLLDKPGAIYLY